MRIARLLVCSVLIIQTFGRQINQSECPVPAYGNLTALRIIFHSRGVSTWAAGFGAATCEGRICTMVNPDPLPPISTPLDQSWREFRVRFLPVVVFLGVLAATVFMWGNLGGAGVPGMAEGTRSIVSAPRLGYVQELLVQPFQQVAVGTPILRLQPIEPEAELNALQAELQLVRLRLEPALADRNAFDYERIRVDLLLQKQQLALAQVNLTRAESALRRNEALRKDQLVSEDLYELALRDRDLYRSQTNEITQTITQLEQRLTDLSAVGESKTPGVNPQAAQLVTKLEARLRSVRDEMLPITLVAPISGIVHAVLRQSGEAVVEGEPLVLVNSPHADRIVAFVRQPYSFTPRIGLPVEIVTRNPPRQRFQTQVSQVGAQLEAITNSLAVLLPGKLVDAGLQIVLPVPPELSIRPGEIVDVHVKGPTLAHFFQRPAKLEAGTRPRIQ